jgi:hypothetical protein
LTKAATVFISYLAHHANELTQKKTVGPHDVLKALQEIEMAGVMELGQVGADGRVGGRLERELEVFERVVRGKRKGYREKVKKRESGTASGALNEPMEGEDVDEEEGGKRAGVGGEPEAKRARLDDGEDRSGVQQAGPANGKPLTAHPNHHHQSQQYPSFMPPPPPPPPTTASTTKGAPAPLSRNHDTVPAHAALATDVDDAAAASDENEDEAEIDEEDGEEEEQNGEDDEEEDEETEGQVDDDDDNDEDEDDDDDDDLDGVRGDRSGQEVDDDDDDDDEGEEDDLHEYGPDDQLRRDMNGAREGDEEDEESD